MRALHAPSICPTRQARAVVTQEGFEQKQVDRRNHASGQRRSASDGLAYRRYSYPRVTLSTVEFTVNG
jgi:hypothetical protein